MIEKLPDIPRIITALAEWSSCLLFLLPQKKRFGDFGTLAFLAVACVGQYALQTLAGSFTERYWLLGMLMNVLFMFAFIWIVGELKVPIAAYWCAIAFVAAEFMAALEWQISCVIFPEGARNGAIGPIAIFLPIFFLVLGLIYYMEKKVEEIGRQISGHQAFIAVILAIIAFIISNSAFLNARWNSTVTQQYFVYYIRTLVDLCVLIILYLQQWTMQGQQTRDELASINHVLNLQYKQYLDFKESSEYISRQCHDLKHQIEALRGACTNEEREAYLKEMENAIARYNGQNVTGNAVLDTLLTRKKIYCLQHNIEFSVFADGRDFSFLSVKDICTIVGNILDNAIEYVSELEQPQERQIFGEIYRKDSFLIIRLENYYRGDQLEGNDLPVTTKMDKLRHGFGLKSVRYIVEKNNGSMTLRTENQSFIVRVLIPMP